MKKIIVPMLAGSLLMFASPSFAEEILESNVAEPTVETTAEPEPEPTAEPEPEPTAEPEPEPTVEPTVEPEPEPTYDPGMSPGEHAGWLAVDQNGNPVSESMVCTPEVCGQTGPGSWLDLAIQSGVLPPNSRLVLQTLQDPVEAANSSNGVGNVAGYNNANYNSANGSWSFVAEDGGTYRIPLAYPGSDLDGNENNPECIENCPPPPCSEDPNYLEREDCADYVSGPEPVSATSYTAPTTENDPEIIERSKSFVITNNEVGFNKVKISFYKKTTNIKIIAKKWDEVGVQKKVWKIKKKRPTKQHTFKIPKQFIGWKIIVKNKKNIKDISLL